MQKKKGFTLVELLIAATIIGILVVFATVQYRSGAAETRWAEAKSRAHQLADALIRLDIDYGLIKLRRSDSGKPVYMENPKTIDPDECELYPGRNDTVVVSQLIQCGFLETGPWSAVDNEYYWYYICDHGMVPNGGDRWDGCENYVACVAPIGTAVLPWEYRNKKYCIDGTGKGTEGVVTP